MPGMTVEKSGVLPAPETLTPEAEAKEKERQAKVQELLQARRLLKADLRVAGGAFNELRDELPVRISRSETKRVKEIKIALAEKEVEITDLNAAVDVLDKQLAALLPNQQHGRHLVVRIPNPRLDTKPRA